MHRDYAVGAVRRRAEARAGLGELLVVERTPLLSPGPNGVEADDDERVRDVRRLRLPEDALPARERPREPGWDRVRDVVVPGHGEQREPEPTENLRRAPELIRAAAVRQVAGRDQEIGPERRSEVANGEEGREILSPTHVRVGDVENARCHGRWRLPRTKRTKSGDGRGIVTPRR
jgi:hypothetical protein